MVLFYRFRETSPPIGRWRKKIFDLSEVGLNLKRIIALVLVLCVLMAGALYVYRKDRADQQYMLDMYSQVEPLQQQIDELEKQKKNLQQEYEKKKRDPGTIQLLVRDLGTDIFDKVYPIMRTHGVTGVLGVSTASRPIRSGKWAMTVEQYNRLILDGWGTCLIYDGKSFDEYYSNMQHYMESFNLAMPTAIYFPNGYDETLEQSLLDCGINTVIVNAADGHTNTVTEFGDIWVTGAMPWNYTGVMSDLDLLAETEGGNLTFTLSTSDILDEFESKPFTEMMEKWYTLITDAENDPYMTPTTTSTAKSGSTKVDPLLVVATYENARTAHEMAYQNGLLLDWQLNIKLSELDGQISSLTAQIQDIYAAMNASRNNGLLSSIFG